MGIQQAIKEVKSIEIDLENNSLRPVPDYLIQVDIHGNIVYTNPEVRAHFPKIIREGISHPLLGNWEQIADYIISNHHQCIREISFNQVIYQQKFFYNPATRLVNIIVQKASEDNLSGRNSDENGEQRLLLTHRDYLNRYSDHQSALQIFVDAAAELINSVNKAEIYLYQSTKEALDAVATAPYENQIGINNTNKAIPREIAEEIMSSRGFLHITDTKDAIDIPNIPISPQTRSLMIMPIIAAEEPVGILSVQSYTPSAFSQQDELILSSLASLTAESAQNINIVKISQRRLREVNSLFNISQGISESLNIETMLKRVVNLLQDQYGYDHILIYLLNEASGDMILEYGSGLVGLKLKRKQHYVRSGQGIVGNVALNGFPFVTNEVHHVPFYIPNPLLPNIQSEMSVPIHTTNRLIGILDIQLEPPKKFTDSELKLMTNTADLLANGIEKSILYSALQSALRQEQAMRAQLVQSEKLAAIGRIVASVAHELNNPLQAIQNALYLVQLENSTDPQMNEDLQVAISETRRMAELITRLRHTYRPKDNQKYEFQDIPLLIEEVIKLISTHLRHHDVLFNFNADEDIPACPVIRDQIKQVLLNICLNAVESMPYGGKLSIKVQHLSNTSELSVTISDTGPGISPEIRPFIFDPFVTTKENGTGLGLAISHEIIQRHNGSIEVFSRKNHGTTFIIKLPMEVKNPSI